MTSPATESLEVLIRLGFSEYEAKTYLALLHESPATGYQISKEAGIPRSMVYEALGRLAHRGAVMSLPSGDTTRYAPVPVSALLDGLRHTYESTIDQALVALSHEEQAPPREQVWNIDGHEAVLARARDMLRAAQRSVLASLDDQALAELLPTLRDADARGVELQLLLVGESEADFGLVARHPSHESALQQLTGSLVIVADDDCLIGGSATAESCIWTGNRQVVFIARQFVWQEIFSRNVLSPDSSR